MENKIKAIHFKLIKYIFSIGNKVKYILFDLFKKIVNYNYSDKYENIIYHFRVWFVMSKKSFRIMLSKKILFFMFLLGKLTRFAFFLVFLTFLLKGTETVAGYNLNQTLFFFLTFNLIDIVAQFLFRDVYRFRPKLVSGELDLIMAKPTNVLFRVLLGGADVIDLVTIPPLIFAIVFVGRMLNPNLGQVVLYLLLTANGLLISAAFHIAVLSMGILTLEIDHTIMIYRDILNLGRLPVEIYKEPIRSILTFLIPVGLMISLPAKSLMGFTKPSVILISFLIGILGIYLSLKFWNKAIRNYTSASS
jgi:ABC-2 type transport system permease protein